jgi:hypothetical protein
VALIASLVLLTLAVLPLPASAWNIPGVGFVWENTRDERRTVMNPKKTKERLFIRLKSEILMLASANIDIAVSPA